MENKQQQDKGVIPPGEWKQYTGKNGYELKGWSNGNIIESPVLEPDEDNPTGEYIQIAKAANGVRTVGVGGWIWKHEDKYYPVKSMQSHPLVGKDEVEDIDWEDEYKMLEQAHSKRHTQLSDYTDALLMIAQNPPDSAKQTARNILNKYDMAKYLIDFPESNTKEKDAIAFADGDLTQKLYERLKDVVPILKHLEVLPITIKLIEKTLSEYELFKQDKS